MSTNVPTRAMILAAGRGERLRPLTDRVAKPALPFCGTPVLGRLLDLATEHGVEEATINLHHAPESVRALVGERRARPPLVRWSDETERLLGTAGALIPVRDHFRQGDAFFFLNGDCVHSLDLGALAREHGRRRAESSRVVATVAVRDHAEPGFACLRSEGDRIVAFGVRAEDRSGEHHYLSAMVIEPELLDLLPDAPQPYEIFGSLLPDAIARGHEVAHATSRAEWHALDTPERYLEATRDFLERRGRGAHVADDAEVAPGAVVSPESAIHERCRVERGARILHAVLLPGAVVGEGAHVERSILGPHARIGPGERVVGEVRA